jgi:Zinc finger, C3HC4 type (RING finger)
MEECIICFEDRKDFVPFPCAHKVCVICYPKLNRCPLCNQARVELDILIATEYTEIPLTPTHTTHTTHTQPRHVPDNRYRVKFIHLFCYVMIIIGIFLFIQHWQ